jgi:hypothetical protein
MFLEKWVMEHGSLPDFARSSWETSKNIIDKIELIAVDEEAGDICKKTEEKLRQN